MLKEKRREERSFMDVCISAKSLALLSEQQIQEAFDCASAGNLTSAYNHAYQAERFAERFVQYARALPCYTGSPTAKAKVTAQILYVADIQIGFTEHGWFCVKMPMLLPKKDTADGSSDYIRSILYPAMERFFTTQPPITIDPCVLIFRHVYTAGRPARAWRDHDNIEVKTVTDIIAEYVMVTDSPKHCSQFHTSSLGKKERTEIYVLPKSEFRSWLAQEPLFPEDGLALN